MAYSRRQTIEEKNNKRKTVGFILLSIGFVLFMFFYGLPLLVKLANLAYDFKKGSEVIYISDTTPPPPPKIDPLPNSTSKDSVTFQGSSESGSIVIVKLNNIANEVVTDNEGRFSTTLKLKDGDNLVKAYAMDSTNNKSQESQTFTITLDNKPPELEITSPSDNSDYFGSTQKLLTIKGKTEENSKVQINDRLAIVDANGNFSFSATLSPGTNTFTVKSTDLADNTSEKILQINFTP